MATFNELGLSPQMTRAISEMGFEEATPIQEKTIPLALQGSDIIGQAQTGTGKTAAFGIPVIERVDPTNPVIQALIMAPTRELAIQVAEEIGKLGSHSGVRVLPVYGGQEIGRQIRALKNRPHIIIGTPGRLLDHIRRKTIRLQNVATVVLDEADEMLDMGFVEDIESILTEIPEERQGLFFSATMPPQIKRLTEKFLRNPEHVAIKAKEVTVPNISQYYMELQERQKFDVLCRLLDIDSPELAIVFGRTKRRVDELNDALNKRGYMAEGIHGDLSQRQRDVAMRKFREGQLEVLVATDVAARGLDVSGVTHVYNFDIPQDPESYVHRIGRTGRAGKTGSAVTFVTPRESDHRKIIEKVTKRHMDRRPIPSMVEAMEGKQRVALDRLVEVMEEGGLNDYQGMAEEVLHTYNAIDLVAAALKMLTKSTNNDVEIQLTAEAPVRTKKIKRRDSKPFGNGGGNRGRGDYRGGDRGGRSGDRNRGGGSGDRNRGGDRDRRPRSGGKPKQDR